MTISVILCTYNRCPVLATALASVATSQMPPSVEWEVLVVDNNSRDQTPEVVEEFCSRYPGRFRYLFEPRQGLSNARNAGIRAARGEIIAFTDDDVTVEPTWLQNLTANLCNGEWSCAGGRILPPASFSPPRWLPTNGRFDLRGALVIFDPGDEPGKLDRTPFGANMAFRKAMFEKYGFFRTDLGRCGKGLIGNEEFEFCRRLVTGGENLRYEPSAVVYHPVPPERLTKRYFLAWHFAFGRAMVRQAGRRPLVWGVPEHYFSIVSRTLRWTFTVDPPRRFFWKTRVWSVVGEILESYRQSLPAGRRTTDNFSPEGRSVIQHDGTTTRKNSTVR